MMNYNQICKEVSTDVKDMMVEAIEKGEDSLWEAWRCVPWHFHIR